MRSNPKAPEDPPAVLCVDDESVVLKLFARVLSPEFRVEVASDGRSGLELLETSGPFAVVIADLSMPGTSGSTFLAEVRHRTPKTIRVLITGCGHVGGAAESVAAGHVHYFLTKPCSQEELLRVVRDGAAQHRRLVAERRRHLRPAA
jgi:DNA-binding NtrC family response regulator